MLFHGFGDVEVGWRAKNVSSQAREGGTYLPG